MISRKQGVDGEHTAEEAYISVDVETSGAIPGEYSLLSLGAYLVGSATVTFYIELQPITDKFVPEAVKVGGLALDQLKERGVTPANAMRQFHDWINEVT